MNRKIALGMYYKEELTHMTETNTVKRKFHSSLSEDGAPGEQKGRSKGEAPRRGGTKRSRL